MATLRFSASLLVVAGCGDLQGLGGDVPPLTTIQLEVTGDFETVRLADNERLRVSVVWGAQWLAEPTCASVPATLATDVANVLLSGCRNPFTFTPARIGDSVEVEPNTPIAMTIDSLPAGDVFVGTLSARIAYASFIVFDDRDGSGRLELGRTQRPPIGDPFGPEDADGENPMQDLVYGASFAAMTEPDTRLAFREGDFNLGAAYYPRSGCGEPLPRFSLLSAGGFSIADAYNTTQTGETPMQDPTTCKEEAPEQAVVSIALRTGFSVNEAACRQWQSDGQTRFRQPPREWLELSDRAWACRTVPDTDVTELLVTQRTSDPCRGITHYVLRGCDDGSALDCNVPEWDLTNYPPDWWPCTEVTP